MIKKYVVWLVILICVSVFLILLFVSEDPKYKIDRVLKYSFTVSNPNNEVVKKSYLWAYLPVKITSTQEFVSVDASHEYRVVEDGLGNQRLFFDLTDFPPYGSKIITVKVHVNMSDQPNNIEVKDLAIYLRNEKYIESDDASIKLEASKLRQNDELKTVRGLYSWVVEKMDYKGFVSEDRGALFALQNGTGDCTEYSYLYTALARAVNLPSRSVAGFVYNENARLVAKDYHNWSEVRIGDKWLLVDPQKEVIMDQYDDYIAMRIISSSIDDAAGGSQEYFHVEPPLVAKMN